MVAVLVAVNAGKKLAAASVGVVVERLLAVAVAAGRYLPRTNASHCPKSQEKVNVVGMVVVMMGRDAAIS